MSEYLQSKESAVRNLTIADHVLTMTYPLVQDPKLLKLVIRKIYEALEDAMAMLLYYEKEGRRQALFRKEYSAMLPHMKKIFERYKISKGYINFLIELRDILNEQKKADVEFVRKEKFVFASKEYNLTTITKKEIKDYLAKAKLFIRECIGVVEENG